MGVALLLGVARAAVTMLVLRRVPPVAIALGGLTLAALAIALVTVG